MKFMHLPEKLSGEHSLYHVLPVAYEGKTTWGKGASVGASSIISASKHLEYYDEQYCVEAYENGIYTHPLLDLADTSAEDAMQKISEKAAACADRFLLTIGGDHSVTIGAVSGLAQKHNFSVLILDAHADFLYSWNGSSLNHACVARRLVAEHNVGIVGVRSMGREEDEEVGRNDNISLVKAHAFSLEAVEEMLQGMEKNVYISLDVDVFDPSFIRSTGTPEPGGLGWYDVLAVLEKVFASKHVIGADIVEFSGGDDAEAFSIAKLGYKLLGLHARAVEERAKELHAKGKPEFV